jgi:hypothetical protein
MTTFEGRRWAVIAFVTNAVLVVAIVVAMLLLTTADTRSIPGFGIVQWTGTVLPWLNFGGAIAAMLGAKRRLLSVGLITSAVGLSWMAYVATGVFLSHGFGRLLQ